VYIYFWIKHALTLSFNRKTGLKFISCLQDNEFSNACDSDFLGFRNANQKELNY